MSQTWKTVRVFISSTFRDMQSERDRLVRFVFPKLRQELLQRRIHLVDVDLRWGVTSEQDALSVCREVVDECRPRFLCMLGGRYGWVPPGKTRSITADEVHYGVLDRDLKSRGFAYFYFRDPAATAAMVEVTPGEFREPAGSHGAVALAALKTAITGAGLQPFIYRAQWNDQSRRLIGLKEFGDRVYEDLKQSIDQEFGPTTGEKPDEFTEENAAMEAFIEEGVQRFVLGSRESVLKERQRPLRQQGLEPSGYRGIQAHPLTVLKDGHLPEWGSQVVVVEDERIREFAESGLEIGQGAGETGDEFHGRHVVATLGNAHGDALFGYGRPGNPDEAEHHGVAGFRRLLQESQFVAHRIGEDGFEHEAFALLHQLTSEGVGHLRGGVGGEVEFPRQHVGVDETQPGGLEMRVVEGGLACAVRPHQCHDDGTLVQRQAHRLADLVFAAWNCRLTKRPSVRLPSASMRTSNPGASGAGS